MWEIFSVEQKEVKKCLSLSMPNDRNRDHDAHCTLFSKSPQCKFPCFSYVQAETIIMDTLVHLILLLSLFCSSQVSLIAKSRSEKASRHFAFPCSAKTSLACIVCIYQETLSASSSEVFFCTCTQKWQEFDTAIKSSIKSKITSCPICNCFLYLSVLFSDRAKGYHHMQVFRRVMACCTLHCLSLL